MMRIGLCALALVMALSPSVARADPTPDEILADGLSLFQDLEYRAAIEVLEPLLLDADVDPALHQKALELTGISWLALDRRDKAEAVFRELLEADPDYQLTHHDGSPKIRGTFEHVRRRLARPPTGGDIQLSLERPDRPRAGRSAEFGIVVQGDGADQVSEVVFLWRRAGEPDYAQKVLRRRDDGVFRGSVRLPDGADDFSVEVTAEARNIAGGAVGRLGERDSPIAVQVSGARIDEDGSPPWYKRWYVWAGAAAAAGAGTLLWVGLDSGSRSGTLQPGRITLSP